MSVEKQSQQKFDELLNEMIIQRMEVCSHYGIKASHRHTIGCTLVLQYMKEHHSDVEYGTQKQWELEAAFCVRHERELMKRFLLERMGPEKATRLLEILSDV